jgi:hypothetical protein
MLLTARSGLGATLHVSLLVSSYPVYELFFLGCFLSADDHGSTLQPPPVPAAGFLLLIFLLFGNVRGVAVVWTLFFFTDVACVPRFGFRGKKARRGTAAA